MALISDIFKKGFLFQGATGEKSGINLEDLVTRAVPTSGTQLVDQVTIEDYEDAALQDDFAANIRRLRVKAASITSAHLASDVSTLIPTAADAKAFQAYVSSAQSIPSQVATKVEFDGEEFDYASEYDAVTNFRFTAVVDGLYLINAMVEVAVQTGQWATAYIYKNGALYKSGEKGSTNNSEDTGSTVVAIVPLDAGDYVEIFVFQSNSASQAVNVGATDSLFSGYLIAKT